VVISMTFPSGEGVRTAIIGAVSGNGANAAALTALTRHTRYAALRDNSSARRRAFLEQARFGERDMRTDASRFLVVPGRERAVIVATAGAVTAARTGWSGSP
jgi:hypothetical protein